VCLQLSPASYRTRPLFFMLLEGGGSFLPLIVFSNGSLAFSDVEDHTRREHSLVLNPAEAEPELDWLDVAQKENIHLECPLCSNTFQKEGFRWSIEKLKFYITLTLSTLFN